MSSQIYTYGYNVIADPPSAYTDLSPTLYPISAPSSSGGSSSKGGSSCFAGTEIVTMQSGEMRAICEVTVGDRVLAADVSGETLFSEVVFVPHGDNKESAPFGHIRT